MPPIWSHEVVYGQLAWAFTVSLYFEHGLSPTGSAGRLRHLKGQRTQMTSDKQGKKGIEWRSLFYPQAQGHVLIFPKSSNIISSLICADITSKFKIHWHFVKVTSIYSLESMLKQCNCGGLKKYMVVNLQLNICIIPLSLIGYTWGSIHLVANNTTFYWIHQYQ